jgi:hypothetical protein
MATYLQGITDQVNVINPPQIDAQFEMQLLQARQSKYDQAHAEVSKLYSSILNSSLSRTDNKEARDEFFKLIENDIKRIAQTDLSLQSNAKAAENLFSQIYDNDYLVKDMVWTKNYNQQMGRAEGFKNCVKPEDCGGMYWDGGVKYMQYKKEEFQNASRDEALGMGDVEYIPYQSVMDEALKYAKEADFKITQTSFSKDGKYLISTTNDPAAVFPPLQALFQGTVGSNPKVMDMYKVMTYNERNDWMRSEVQKGNYNTLNEARVGYLKERYDQSKETFDKTYKNNTILKEQLESNLKTYESLNKTQKGLTKDQLDNYNRIQSQLNSIEGLTQSLEAIKQADNYINNENTQTNLEAMLTAYDNRQAFNLLNEDLDKAAIQLGKLNYSQEREADKVALQRQKFEYDVRMEEIRQQGRIDLEKIKASNSRSNNLEFIQQEMSQISTASDEIKANNYTERIFKSLEEAKVFDDSNYSITRETLEKQMQEPNWSISKIKDMLNPPARNKFENEMNALEAAQNKRLGNLANKYIDLAEKIGKNKFTYEDEQKLFDESNINNMKMISDDNTTQDIMESYAKVLDKPTYIKLFIEELGWTYE